MNSPFLLLFPILTIGLRTVYVAGRSAYFTGLGGSERLVRQVGLVGEYWVATGCGAPPVDILRRAVRDG